MNPVCIVLLLVLCIITGTRAADVATAYVVSRPAACTGAQP